MKALGTEEYWYMGYKIRINKSSTGKTFTAWSFSRSGLAISKPIGGTKKTKVRNKIEKFVREYYYNNLKEEK